MSNNEPENNGLVETFVEIDSEFIELYKLLKFENLVSSGGEAKFVIAEGLVNVNGDQETRKRKKIVAGDIVDFNGTTLKVTRSSGD